MNRNLTKNKWFGKIWDSVQQIHDCFYTTVQWTTLFMNAEWTVLEWIDSNDSFIDLSPPVGESCKLAERDIMKYSLLQQNWLPNYCKIRLKNKNKSLHSVNIQSNYRNTAYLVIFYHGFWIKYDMFSVDSDF